MVQLANPGKLRQGMETPVKSAADAAAVPMVKLEIEDPLEDEHGPLTKKPKSPGPFQQQWDVDAEMVPPQSIQCSLLDEPSPLGLRLKKSPSFLDLIQMRLSQGGSATASCIAGSGGLEGGKKKDLKSTAVSGITDKLKASNFPASLLKIGSWECVSRYEGDLVAKCYYAKHKLVWEVLDGGLKSKIEIQWSDITALKASCPDNAPGTLDIVLARQPLFFRETNPQPRKHTLWQATSDFTNGQASIHRRWGGGDGAGAVGGGVQRPDRPNLFFMPQFRAINCLDLLSASFQVQAQARSEAAFYRAQNDDETRNSLLSERTF
ncbi:uncharacterized protein A4U43_C05F34220 [Asparagus officinalis]|uniref:TRF2/HOY1 PH-like domain-containing protein n=1 Tax=Asparagus officinalis TaxID=4686 RepID=A0A5P1EZA5_ASPOF|nr:uncharacterized protein A4U43_C05F34220 [Asparagus officinalis]